MKSIKMAPKHKSVTNISSGSHMKTHELSEVEKQDEPEINHESLHYEISYSIVCFVFSNTTGKTRFQER